MVNAEIVSKSLQAMPALPPLPPLETARYMGDMLESLGKLARKQGQELLAHLLDLARLEAKSLARSEDEDQKP